MGRGDGNGDSVGSGYPRPAAHSDGAQTLDHKVCMESCETEGRRLS